MSIPLRPPHKPHASLRIGGLLVLSWCLVGGERNLDRLESSILLTAVVASVWVCVRHLRFKGTRNGHLDQQTALQGTNSGKQLSAVTSHGAAPENTAKSDLATKERVPVGFYLVMIPLLVVAAVAVMVLSILKLEPKSATVIVGASAGSLVYLALRLLEQWSIQDFTSRATHADDEETRRSIFALVRERLRRRRMDRRERMPKSRVPRSGSNGDPDSDLD